MLRLISCCCVTAMTFLALVAPCVCIAQPTHPFRVNILKVPFSFRAERVDFESGALNRARILTPTPVRVFGALRTDKPVAHALDWWRGGSEHGGLLNGWAGNLLQRGPLGLNAPADRPATSKLAPRPSTMPMPRNMVYVRLSTSFLRRYGNQSIQRSTPVVDDILGVAVQGTSTTTAQTELTLTPDARRGRSELRIVGSTSFDVTGHRGRVRIGAQGIIEFHAEKTLLLDGYALRPMPTRIDANTRLTVTRASTRLPGLRGRIVQGLAARRMARRSSEAEYAASRRTERRVALQIDQWIDQQVVAFAKPLVDLANELPHDSPALPKEVRCSTTRDLLEVIVLGSADGKRKLVSAPASDPNRPDVEVHVHASLVRQLLSDPELRPVAQAVAESMLSLAGSATVAATATPTAGAPTSSVQWSDDGDWLTLAWSGGPQFDRSGIPTSP